MNQLESAFLGAAGLAIAYLAFRAGREAWRLVREVRAALAGIPAMVEANRRSAAKLEELVGLFTVAATGTPNFGVDASDNPAVPMGQGQGRRYPLQERPVRPWDTYPTDYEAREDETEVIDTTDEELAKLEAVEAIREKGFSVEEDESIEVAPPGVTASV